MQNYLKSTSYRTGKLSLIFGWVNNSKAIETIFVPRDEGPQTLARETRAGERPLIPG